MKPYVPLGILYISGYLREKGISHEVFDTTFSDFGKFSEYLLKNRPRLIGIYTNLMTKINVLRTIGFIRASPELSNCKIVLGGPEIRYNAENYLAHGADMLVIGEGEETFYEIAREFQMSGELPAATDGTAYKSGGEIKYTNERTLIRQIDALPMPARDRIQLELYGKTWKERHGYSMYSISTMRGCPYTCKWCSRAVYGGTYRRRSPRLVVEEMRQVRDRYDVDRLWFVDDVFTISHNWLRGFRDELNRAGVSIPFEIITRADRMSDEVIAILKEIGCFRVWIGAESGSQEIIDAMDRRVNVEQVREMIIKTRAAGIQAGTFIMLGYPGEERSHIRETIKHLKLSHPDEYTITLAYPITGTPLHDEVKDEMSAEKPWHERTDRDLVIKRPHSHSWYRFALTWINSEVGSSRAKKPSHRIRLKAKSLLAQTLMMLG
jgi:anaerobic magnesium-protoporphyrin IX monomethyl ester cyclase